jgi:hypothetical protein
MFDEDVEQEGIIRPRFPLLKIPNECERFYFKFISRNLEVKMAIHFLQRLGTRTQLKLEEWHHWASQ